MKNKLHLKIAVLVTALTTSTLAFADDGLPTPLFQFDFNSTSDSASLTSSGTSGGTLALVGTANTTVSGTGVSGRQGDYAFTTNATSHAATDATKGNAGIVTVNTPALTEFTLTMWIKPDMPFSKGAMFGRGEAGKNLILNFSGGANSTTNRVGGWITNFDKSGGSGFSSFMNVNPTGDWVFVALTYKISNINPDTNKGQGTLIGYTGTTDPLTSASLVRTLAGDAEASSAIAAITGGKFSIGNDTSANGTNVFAGQMDDIRFYTTALSSAQVEDVRMSALNYGAVPESETAAALLGLGGAVAAAVTRYLKRR